MRPLARSVAKKRQARLDERHDVVLCRCSAEALRGEGGRVEMPRVFLALVTIGLTLTARSALPSCTRTCRLETARCVSTRCVGLRGTARRTCLNTCKGIGGCARIGKAGRV